MNGSIIRRIIIGFGIVLALALIIAVVGITALSHARRANTDIAAQVLVDDVLSRDAQAQFLRADLGFARIAGARRIRAGAPRDAEIRKQTLNAARCAIRSMSPRRHASG